jgi:putative PIN family toxin of toxin-antitoxin system
MRLVADTNTIVSGLLWQGAPRRLMDAADAGLIQLVSSEALLAELARVLRRDKFAARLRRSVLTAERVLDGYRSVVEVVTPTVIPPTVLVDPDDDAVLAAAVGGNAAVIVSGDRDLLDLRVFRQIPILRAGEALELIA